MDELLNLHEHGLFLRREALQFGYDDRDLQHARRDGVLVRIRQGAYVPVQVWSSMDATERFRLRGRAVVLSHAGHVALSHTSAAVEHGLRLWGVDLSRVHVVRLDGPTTGGRAHDVVYHRDNIPDHQLVARRGLLLHDATRAAIDTAALHSVESGLVTVDSLLDLGLGDLDSVNAAYRLRSHWPNSRRLQTTLRLARPGAQSAGESRGRYLFWSQHLPAPVLQFKVYDDNGELIGITDFAWPDHRLLGEFDGRMKYGRLVPEGRTAADVLFEEKQREDALREVTGCSMIRYIWNDFSFPERTAARTRRMLFMRAV